MSEKAISDAARLAAMETSHPSGDPRFAALDRTIESYNREPTSLIPRSSCRCPTFTAW
jgi:hypothetical protein